jgi:four helix bundle protein
LHFLQHWDRVDVETSAIPQSARRDCKHRQWHATCVTANTLTERFPRSELYGLTNQLRRAAVSIPANVAEGHCRRETKPFRHHVSIALGSHGELETYFELAVRLGFLSAADQKRVLELSDSVGRLLHGLHR